jgi:hypothetical protein
MSKEGISDGSTHGEERGPARRAAEAGWAKDIAHEQKTESLEKLAGEYQMIQRELITLNEDLHTGNARIEKNPRMRELAIQLGREIQFKIDEKDAAVEKLKQQITEAGGNPSDYTFQ